MIRRFAVVLALLAALVPAGARAQSRVASEKLVEGVWAAPTPGGSNVGWFTAGAAIVAVDAGLSEEVGRAIVAEIQRTTGKKPAYLVVTHAHRDHAGGAQAFAEAGAQILCADKAAPGVLSVLASAAHSASGGKSAGSLPLLTVGERSFLLSGEGRRVEIDFLGPAHTSGDLVVTLPDDGVLFPGDLAVSGVLPFLRSADADPANWEKILPRLAALKIEKMVPGHGLIGPKDGIADTSAYIARVNDIVQRLLMTNPSDTMIDAQLRAPENQIENVRITPDHVANVKALYQRAHRAREKPDSGPTPTPRPQAP